MAAICSTKLSITTLTHHPLTPPAIEERGSRPRVHKHRCILLFDTPRYGPVSMDIAARSTSEVLTSTMLMLTPPPPGPTHGRRYGKGGCVGIQQQLCAALKKQQKPQPQQQQTAEAGNSNPRICFAFALPGTPTDPTQSATRPNDHAFFSRCSLFLSGDVSGIDQRRRCGPLNTSYNVLQ